MPIMLQSQIALIRNSTMRLSLYVSFVGNFEQGKHGCVVTDLAIQETFGVTPVQRNRGIGEQVKNTTRLTSCILS